jgi:hypothetical protein
MTSGNRFQACFLRCLCGGRTAICISKNPSGLAQQVCVLRGNLLGWAAEPPASQSACDYFTTGYAEGGELPDRSAHAARPDKLLITKVITSRGSRVALRQPAQPPVAIRCNLLDIRAFYLAWNVLETRHRRSPSHIPTGRGVIGWARRIEAWHSLRHWFDLQAKAPKVRGRF